jgi:hypothetical protein
MEYWGSLQHLKQPTTCPYFEPDESSPHTLILFIKTVLILSSTYAQVNQVPSFLQVTSSEHSIYIYIYLFIYSPEITLITQLVFGSNTTTSAPHYATVSSLTQYQILETWPSLSVTDQVSHPYKVTGKITFCLQQQTTVYNSEQHDSKQLLNLICS